MKRTLTIIAMSMIAVAATAQDMYDALTFSQSYYQGTARTIGMGNAVTAVGGDLGSIGINPAGGAVAGYGQITITPGVSLAASSSQYTPVFGTDYTTKTTDAFSKANLPNIGFAINWKTGRNHGIKSWSFGMVSNITNDFSATGFSFGQNDETSMLGAFADNASRNGISASRLQESDAYYNTYSPWANIAAYQSGMIATYGGSDYNFIGTTEKLYGGNVIALAGELEQKYGYQRRGSKNDIVFNFAANVNDVLYFGGNLGVTTMNYQSDMYFKEKALNPNDFDIEYTSGETAYFNDSRYRYSYNAEGDGVYLKVGVIAKPVPGLRLGAAIQTPTVLTITERWQYACDVNFTESKFNGAATSPEGEYRYNLVTPYRVNAGVAYNILGMAMISADYEMVDYSTMRFRTYDSVDNTEFYDTNKDIKSFCGLGHNLRVGAEIKPIPMFAIRAGYNFSTSGEYTGDTVKKACKDFMHSASIGLGYSSNGSFFADVAYKISMFPTKYIQPYNDYITDDSDNIVVYSPEITRSEMLHNIVATIGWRF